MVNGTRSHRTKKIGPRKKEGKNKSVLRNEALDGLVEFPFEKERERERKADRSRVREIKTILGRLKRCCRSYAFRWPEPKDLNRLDVLVSELVRRVRKRQPILPRKRYKAIDAFWHLNSWRIILELIDRAATLTPPRPLERYNLLLSDEKLSDLTKAFFEHYAKVNCGTDPSSIDWHQFDELFKRTRRESASSNLPLASRLGELGGKPKLIAYTVFLELYCDDQRWAKQHWVGASTLTFWVAFDLQHSEMLQKLRKFVVPAYFGGAILEAPTRISRQVVEHMKERDRAKDRERKRRKKLAQN